MGSVAHLLAQVPNELSIRVRSSQVDGIALRMTQSPPATGTANSYSSNGTTILASDLVGGEIFSNPSSNITLQMPTSANITTAVLAQMNPTVQTSALAVGSTFTSRVSNPGANTVTLSLTGTAISNTYSTNLTIGAASTRQYDLQLATNSNGVTTYYIIG
jgi:hypothetical protein